MFPATENSDRAARRGLVAGGNWVSDHVKMIDMWPPQDALASISSETISNGGGPYNVLKNLARLGAPFPLRGVGLVGEDVDGRRILDDCRAHHIDTAQLRTTRDAPTSFTDVMTVQGTGRRTFFHQRGANRLLDVEHFDFTSTPARWFHFAYLLLLDRLDAVEANGLPRIVRVLEAARAAGMTVSIDLVSEHSDRFAKIVRPALAHADVLFANDFEAEKLTGFPLRDSTGVLLREATEKAAGFLLDAGVRERVFLHFPEGVYAASRSGESGESAWQASVNLPAIEIKGAVGAGDALAAGVIFGLHENLPLQRSLELGVCAAAACLRHETCSEGILPSEDCLGLGRKFGFHCFEKIP
ncbi:MAG TPA: carbohydrate kinase family protein [Opitutaceae bacterium]|nr:carbohydrate kinase family protein [Opitutaceae bacterium]